MTITEIIEKQNRTLFESKAGALRDFQTATADLAVAAPRSYDVALCARVLMHFPLQGQIEFRCGASGRNAGFVSPGFAERIEAGCVAVGRFAGSGTARPSSSLKAIST